MRLRDFFSNCSWKSKAIKRAKEINSLNKRIKELVSGRDNIKIKNDKLRDKNNVLNKRIKELENELKKN